MEEISQLIQDMLTKNKTCQPAHDPPPQNYAHPAQATVDGKGVTYFWRHSVTHNLDQNSGICKDKKDGHQTDATYYNQRW